MVKVFLLLMLLFPRDVMGDDTIPEGTAHGTRIITGDDLRQAGVTRLSDILLYIDEWDVMTADGYRWQTSAGQLGYQEQNWDIMLDGQQMELNMLGTRNINMLPVTTDLINYIEVVSEPGLYEGLYVEEGLLHIHTIEPEYGGSFRLRYTAGNETGDPGPYKYTSESSSNIDKIGPDNSASISLKNDSFWVRLNYKYENHAATDPIIESRSRYDSWEDRQARMVMPSIQVETDALPGHHRLFAGGALNGAQTDIFTIPGKSFYRSDLLFIGQNADELPVLSEYFHGGANGMMPIGTATDWSYRITWSSQDIYSPFFRKTPDPSFALSTFSVNSFVCHQKGSAVYTAGGGFDRLHALTDYTLTSRSVAPGSVYLSADIPLTENIRQKITMNMISSGGEIALKDHSTTQWRINEANDLDLSFSASQRLFGEKNSVWFWRERGYLFFDDYAGDIEVDDEFDTSQMLASRISWRYRPRKTLETTTALLYRSFNSFPLVTNQYYFDNTGTYLESVTTVDADTKGQTYGIEFRGRHDPGGSISHYLYARCRLGVYGDRLFRDEQEKLPEYKFSYSAKLAMRHSISIHGRLTVISPTEWADFHVVSNESNGLYPHRLSRQVVADFTIEKWFNQRRVRTMLQLRNLFNHRVQYYPAGALFDMSIYFQIELLLDSLWEL